MNLIRLKFPDQQTAEALLKHTVDGEVVDVYPNTIWLNQGAFYKDGEWDDEGNELEAPTPPTGYHVDLVADECPAPLLPYRMELEPKHPKHVLFTV